MDDFLCSQFISYFSAPLLFREYYAVFWIPSLIASPVKNVSSFRDNVRVWSNQFKFQRKIASKEKNLENCGQPDQDRSWHREQIRVLEIMIVQQQIDQKIPRIDCWSTFQFPIEFLIFIIGWVGADRAGDQTVILDCPCAKRSLHCSTNIFTMQISFSEYWHHKCFSHLGEM